MSISTIRRSRHEVVALIESISGVGRVLHGTSRAEAGLDHERAGDIVVEAAENAWFTYYYWEDDDRAPDFARCVDIHRKPGYDPVELFVDPAIRFPKLKIASKLLQKKLGLRMLMDLIPLDAKLVKGSHGRVPEDKDEWPVIVHDADSGVAGETLDSTQIVGLLRGLMKQRSAAKSS